MSEDVLNYQSKGYFQKIHIVQKRYRVLAFLFDYFIFLAIFMVFGYFWGTPLEDRMGFNLTGLPAFGMMLIGVFLWPVSEGIWGKTLGKRALDLEVVNDRYEPLTPGRAFGRFFLGFADSFFLVGLIVAAVNTQNKRIGDLAAGTLVINNAGINK